MAQLGRGNGNPQGELESHGAAGQVHQDMGALGNGFIETQARQDKRMPPKAPAVIHSRPLTPALIPGSQAGSGSARGRAALGLLLWPTRAGDGGNGPALPGGCWDGDAGVQATGRGLLRSRWDKETEGFD